MLVISASCAPIQISGFRREPFILPCRGLISIRSWHAVVRLVDGKGEVVGIGACVGVAVGASDDLAGAIGGTEGKRLSIEWIAIDAANRVVECGCRVGETPDQLGGRGRVVVRGLGQAKGNACARDGLRVAASVTGKLLLRRGLIGTSNGEVNIL